MGFLHDYGPRDDISDRLAIVGLVFCMLPLFFTLFRLWSKNRYQVAKDEYNRSWLGPWRFGWPLDDYVILLSACLGSAGNALMVLTCYLGFGKRQNDLIEFANPSMPYGGHKLIVETAKIFFVCQVLYTVVMMLTKDSILLMFIHGFDTAATNKSHRICWCLLVVITLFYTGSVFVTIFQCWPISSNWTGHCKPAVYFDNLNLHFWIKAIFNILTDFILANLQVPYIFQTQRTTREKIINWVIVILSNTVWMVAIARTVMIPPADFQQDVMYNSINFCVLSVLEDAVGIICACIPAFREPILRCWPKLLGYSSVGSRRDLDVSFWCRGQSPEKPSDDEASIKSRSSPPKEKDVYAAYDIDLHGGV